MQGSVTVNMNATPAKVWDLISDVTKVGRYSPETFEAEWLGGATGPDVGVKFRGHVKRNGKGPTYWTECKITECSPEQVFTFVVGTDKMPINTWSYRLEANGTETKVTESFSLTPNIGTRLYWALLGWARGKTNEYGMRTTLEKIKAEVEAA